MEIEQPEKQHHESVTCNFYGGVIQKYFSKYLKHVIHANIGFLHTWIDNGYVFCTIVQNGL